MECFNLTVTAVDKQGYELFTRQTQLLGEMPPHLIDALRLASMLATDAETSSACSVLADLMESLFEAGE